MANIGNIEAELNKKISKFDPFFQKVEHKIMVLFYILYVCEKRLGKKKYNCILTPTPKGDIMVDIISSRKRLDPIIITKRKIRQHAKLYELLD